MGYNYNKNIVEIPPWRVDILHEDTTNKAYVLEVNSAPRWEAIAKDTDVNVEREILRFLAEK